MQNWLNRQEFFSVPRTSPNNIAISSSSSTFSTNSSSYVAVTNLSNGLVCNGVPVLIGLIPDGSSNSAYIGASGAANSTQETFIQILRDGSAIYTSLVGSLDTDNPGTNSIYTAPTSVLFIDIPQAGLHTYSIQIKNANGTSYVYYCKLVTLELRK